MLTGNHRVQIFDAADSALPLVSQRDSRRGSAASAPAKKIAQPYLLKAKRREILRKSNKT
jgi:hypothetical protein